MGTNAIPVSAIAKETTVEQKTEEIKSDTVKPKTQPFVTSKLKVDKNVRAADRAAAKLKLYLEAPVGSRQKTMALKELTQIVCSYPKKPILDMVYSAFAENRNTEALNPMNALQGLQMLSHSDNWKARMLYQVMMKLASGDRSMRLSTDTIHNVLGEEIATWVSVKLENIKRRRY